MFEISTYEDKHGNRVITVVCANPITVIMIYAPLANGVYFTVIIIKTPLLNGNCPITDPIIKIEVVHTMGHRPSLSLPRIFMNFVSSLFESKKKKSCDNDFCWSVWQGKSRWLYLHKFCCYSTIYPIKFSLLDLLFLQL